VAVLATATDNIEVAGVQFQVDGLNLGSEDTTFPYSANWDTTATNGAHILTAIARDAAGNTASASITVNVDNSAPIVSINSPAANANVRGVVAVTASATDNVGVAGVQFQLDSTFDFAIDQLTIDGNVNSSGNSDGVPDFFDDFNDGSTTTPPTSALTCFMPTDESGGFLNLRS